MTRLPRRLVLLAAVPLLLTMKSAASTQRVARVGVLLQSTPTPQGTRWAVRRTFVERLRELGWTEGVNLQLEVRWGHGTATGIAAAAAELAALKPDVLVVSGTPGVRALLDATHTIPIVMAGAGDPMGTGLVSSLSRPGGNVTGVSMLGQEIIPKAASLLHELLPKLRRIDLLGSAVNPGNDFFARVWADAVRTIGIEGRMAIVPRAKDIEATIAASRADAIVVLPDPMYLPHLERLFGACLRRGLPAATTGGKAYTEGGALLSYSVNADNLFRQAADYTDRILRGASPAETPIEQPSRYELIFNLKTARALGVDVPRALRLRADEVIE